MKTMTEHWVKMFSPEGLGSVSARSARPDPRLLNHTAQNKKHCDKQKHDESIWRLLRVPWVDKSLHSCGYRMKYPREDVTLLFTNLSLFKPLSFWFHSLKTEHLKAVFVSKSVTFSLVRTKDEENVIARLQLAENKLQHFFDKTIRTYVLRCSYVWPDLTSKTRKQRPCAAHADCCCLYSHSVPCWERQQGNKKMWKTNCATTAKWILPLLLFLLLSEIKASSDCWQINIDCFLFLCLQWFKDKMGSEKKGERKTQRGVRKQRPALSFYLTFKKRGEKKSSWGETQPSLCSRVQMHSISCGWKSLGLRPALSIRQGRRGRTLSRPTTPQHS